MVIYDYTLTRNYEGWWSSPTFRGMSMIDVRALVFFNICCDPSIEWPSNIHTGFPIGQIAVTYDEDSRYVDSIMSLKECIYTGDPDQTLFIHSRYDLSEVDIRLDSPISSARNLIPPTISILRDIIGIHSI